MTQAASGYIEIIKGADFLFPLDLPYSIAGFTFTGWLLDTRDNTTTDLSVNIDTTSNQVDFSLTLEQIENIDAGRHYKFRVRQTDTSAFREIIIDADAEVQP